MSIATLLGSFVAACAPAATSGEPDAARPDASSDSDAGEHEALEREVRALAEPLVDASGSDAARAPGLVAILVTEEARLIVPLGVRSIGGGPVSSATVFQLGSVSKVITGLLLAARVASGLDPDQPANLLLADDVLLPSAGGVEITLAHLASHYGGLPNFPAPPTGPPESPFAGFERAQLSAFLGDLTLSDTPGSAYGYSNLGSGVLGLALADSFAEGSYHQLLSDELTTPLGLSDTDVATPSYLARIADRLASGHRTDAGRLVPVGVATMGVLAASGEILSSAEDVAQLLAVLIGVAPEPRDGMVVRALEPLGSGEPGTSIAYGWNVSDRPEGRVYEKAGLVAGYSAFFHVRREPRVGVAILSARGSHMEIQLAARSIASLAF